MTTAETRPESGIQSSAASPSVTGEGGAGAFSYPELEQLFDLLRYLIDNSDSITLIKGPEGAGKTTLVRRIAALNPPQWALCLINATPSLQSEQLLGALADCYGVEGGDGRFEGFWRRFEALLQADKQAVVLIDDAHLLPVATIIALLRLFNHQADDRPLVKIVLFAANGIDVQLETPQVQAMNLHLIQTLELQPLDREQAAAFVRYLTQRHELRLEQMPLNAARLRRLYRETDGWPGAIEQRLLGRDGSGIDRQFSAQLKSALALLSDLPLPAIASGVAIAFLLVLTWVFEEPINAFLLGDGPGQSQLPTKVPDPGERVVPLAWPESKEPMAAGAESPQRSPGEESPSPAPGEAGPLAVGSAAGTADRDAEAAPVAGQTSVAEPRAQLTEQPVAAVAIPGDQAVSKPRVAEQPGAVARPGDQAVSKPRVAEQPGAVARPGEQAVSKTRVAEQPAAVAKAVAKPRGDKRPEGVDRPAPQAETAGKAPQTAPKGVADGRWGDAWLLKQKPSHYTLQLVAVKNRLAAKRFIDSHHLGREAVIVQISVKGRPWYAVVYGVYPSRGAAVAAARRLPREVGRMNPWPRTLASLQAAIKRR